MDAKELKIVLGYDVETLKRNIETHKKNVALWSEAVQKAKRDIKELERYILLIEESKIGHIVRPNKQVR